MGLAGFESKKLTLEDILNRHRYWVSSLYLEDNKSASEIVQVLQENRLQATVSQIRKVIRIWKLDQLPEIVQPNRLSTISIPSSRSASVRSAMSCSSNTLYPPSDPDVAKLYTHKPLPPLPATKQLSTQQSSSASNRNIPFICQQSLSLNPYELKPRLDSIPRTETVSGPSTLDMYIKIRHNHELLAVGLSNSPPLSMGSHRIINLQDCARSRSRVRKNVRRRRTASGRESQPEKH